MGAIVLNTFGGELPALSANALPANAAQVALNLFAGVNEFRPLQEDLQVTSCPAGTRSIYRLQRRSNGQLNSLDNEGTGWITTTTDRSYVRGQIHDDLTERTYLTDNTVGPWPMVFDKNSTGAPRKLGVPPPARPTTSVQTVKTPFTRTAAKQAGETLADAVRNAVIECTTDPRQGPAQQRASRYKNYTPSGGVPRAAVLTPRNGPDSNYRMGPTEDGLLFPGSLLIHHYGHLWAGRVTSEANKLFGRLDIWRTPDDTYTFFDLNCMPPSWLPEAIDPAIPGRYLLETRLRALVNPMTQAPLLTEDKVLEVLHVLVNGARMKEMQSVLTKELDAVAREFSVLVFDTPAGGTSIPRPIEPTKPTTPQYATTLGGGEPGGNDGGP